MTGHFGSTSWAFLSTPTTLPARIAISRSSTCPLNHERTTHRFFYLPVLAIWGATLLHSYSLEAFVLTQPILWGGHRPYSGRLGPHCQFWKLTKASVIALRQSAVAVEFPPASDSKNDTDSTFLSPINVSTSSLESQQAYDEQISLSDLIETLPALVEQAGRASDRNLAVQAAATAEELWKQYSEKPGASINCKNESVLLFGYVLQAWASVSQRLAELHCMNQQQQQQKSSNSDPAKVFLDNHSLPISTLVDVSQSSIYHAHDAAQQAEQLLHEALNGDAAGSVETVSFNAVLDAWAKSRDPRAAERCAALLLQMKKTPSASPNKRSYHSVLEALAYSQAQDRMEQLHHWYDQMQQQEQHITTATTHTLISAYSRWSRQQSPLYGQKMDAKGSSSQIAQAAVHQLRELQKAFEETRSTDQQPDAPTVTLVLECLSQCRTVQAAQLADEIFTELQLTARSLANENKRYHQPSTQTYLALIQAWRNSGLRSAATRAEALLEEVLKNRNLHPTSALFTAVIQCWGNSGRSDQAAKALGLLQRLRALVKEESSNQQQHQQSSALAPTIRTYNAVLLACAHTKGSDKQQLAALQVAFAVHKAMQLDANIAGSGNHITFATLLRAVGSLLPAGSEERNPVAAAVMKKAIAERQVDRNVIKTLQRACDSTVYASLLSRNMTLLAPGHFDWNTIPEYWCRNVPRQ